MRPDAWFERAIMFVMGLPTCRKVEEFAYDFLDGRLDEKTARRVERHLRACGPCKRFMDSYRKVREIAPQMPRPRLDPKFKDEILEFLMKEKLR